MLRNHGAATFSSSFEIFRYGPREKALQILRAGHSAAFVAMKDTIFRRKALRLNYKGRDLTACPYIVGHPVQEERASVLAVDGIGRQAPPERGEWMCLRLASVKDVGFWISPGVSSITQVAFSAVWTAYTWMQLESAARRALLSPREYRLRNPSVLRRCPQKSKVTRSNRVGHAPISLILPHDVGTTIDVGAWARSSG